MQSQDLSTISKPSVNLNCSLSPEMFNSGKIALLSPLTLTFDEWPKKILRNFFYATSSFVHHSVAISQYKLELQSGNAQFG